MRRTDREVTEMSEILDIVRRAKVLHLGLFDEGYPYIVPLHYGYAVRDGALTFYMHGAKEGHKLDLIRKNPRVCVELECDVEPIPGGEHPCRYGAAYASVMGRGTAALVTEEAEKITGLELLMKHQTGREFTIDGGMAAAVEVIAVTLSEVTAKARPKP